MLLPVLLLACTPTEVDRHAPDRTPGGDDSGPVEADADSDADADTDSDTDADSDVGPCPDTMALVGEACMDLYEAPNRAAALPLVMYDFDEAVAWCQARDKRLCTDDEWELACAGSQGKAYPYGDTHQPGVCNDEEAWLVYSQSELNYWPSDASADWIESAEELFEHAGSLGTGSIAADEVESLYQGEGGGENTGCVGAAGVYDLVGNVEEWTRRADGGTTGFHGNLKGRYWAESRTCQSSVTSHGDGFHFYEIGFRCCRDAE